MSEHSLNAHLAEDFLATCRSNADAIEVTSGENGALGSGALDEVKRLQDMGVSRVIIPPLAFDVEGQRTAFARYAEEVISRC